MSSPTYDEVRAKLCDNIKKVSISSCTGMSDQRLRVAFVLDSVLQDDLMQIA